MALRLTTDGVSVALSVYVPREVGSWTDVTSAINQPHSLKAAYQSPGSYVPPVRRADEIGIEWGWLMVKPIQRIEGAASLWRSPTHRVHASAVDAPASLNNGCDSG